MNNFIYYGGAEGVPGYNCSMGGPENYKLSLIGTKKAAIGYGFIAFGVFFTILYLAIMKIMLSPDLIKLSCYKIMFVIGIYDVVTIFICCILTGYFWVVGATFCTFPNLQYIAGTCAIGFWGGACINCLLLTASRILDIYRPDLMERLFEGNRTWLYTIPSHLYAFYLIFFTPPGLFNSNLLSWFWNPYIKGNEKYEYVNGMHSFNNTSEIVATYALYGILCYVLVFKFNRQTGHSMNWLQKSLIVQSCVICFFNGTGSALFIIIQGFVVPNWVIVWTHICWMMVSTIPTVVYVILNRTIKQTLFGWFLLILPKRFIPDNPSNKVSDFTSSSVTQPSDRDTNPA